MVHTGHGASGLLHLYFYCSIKPATSSDTRDMTDYFLFSTGECQQQQKSVKHSKIRHGETRFSQVANE